MLKKLPIKLKFSLLTGLGFLVATATFAQQPVIATHPRIFLDATTKATLLAKKSANDPDWQAVLAEANNYASGKVIPWDQVSASDAQYYGTNNVFYSYCGSNWEEAAMTLGMAHQLTKGNTTGRYPTAYSNKMLEFADVIIKAYKDFPPDPDGQFNIFQYNTSYATRHVGKTIAIIYDWCYDELSEAQKAGLRHVVTDWFNYMSHAPNTVFQLQYQPTGNYYAGQMICAGYTGLAIAGDDPLAQKMIDFARQRLTGDPGSLNPDTQNSGETSNNYFTQSIKGGLPSYASQTYLGPPGINGSPQRDGLLNQGWNYGGETTQYLIDYILAVKSATGENLLQTDASLKTFFAKNSEAIVHAFTPNHFQIDNSNDYGSFIGSVAEYALPLRLTAILEGTPEGANIEYFYKNQLKPVNLLSGDTGFEILNWEKLMYNKTRPSTPFTYKPYYPVPAVNTYNSIALNSGMHKYYMRKDWGPTSTWAAINMGISAYDGHNHNNAGHFKIIRGDSHDGDDQVLVAANEVSATGGNGVDGQSNYSGATSLSNTLFFNDYNDYDIPYQDYVNTVGGQSQYGYDEPTNEEQNDNFSYFRADLTSAYYISWSDPDTSKRTLKYYYRSFLYLRNSDVFVVYDKLLAKNSTNAAGQYQKHLRWHFLTTPTVNGNNITEVMDNSKLFIHTVIPATTNVNIVNENNNPDNTFGPDDNYLFNTNTWRAEVSVPGNPLKQDIVTVLQPGGKTSLTEMATTAVQTTQNNMEGSIINANGNTEVVLFNNSVLKYPVPVTLTSYAYSGSLAATHTLCGLEPNQKYAVTYSASLVTVTKSATGAETASPSGVLTFKLQMAAQPDDANLTGLAPATGALSPNFAANLVSYTETVSSTTSTIKVTPTAENPAATIKINGVAVASGSPSQAISLAQGANSITVLVTAPNGSTTKTYTLNVNREAPGGAKLANISLIPSTTLTTVTGSDYKDYETAVPATETSVKIIPTAQDATSTITVNGTTVTSGAASADIPLAVGDNVINMVVTASDGITIKTYAIKVTRAAASSNASLTTIKLSPATTLTTVAGTHFRDYTTTVPNAENSVKIIPTAQDATASIKVNGVTVASGDASAAIPLNVGDNIINTVVTAQDGITTKTYSVKVTRGLSSDAVLTIIKLTPATTLTLASGANYRDYTTTVPNTESSVKITPTAQDATATIAVNGIAVASGTASAPITLNVGDNVINTVVTARDGVTIKTYSVKVSRGAASLAASYTGTADSVRAEADNIIVNPGLSPNGDGQNDVLTITNIEKYPDNKLTVISREGVAVFEISGYDNAGKVFDGHSNKTREMLKPGTYFYRLEYTMDGKLKYKTGYIILKY